MTALLASGCGALGLLVGSFLNVVIHRVPRKESVLHPRSRCPNCAVQIAARDNIPVVSWLALRGRCRSCRAPIPARYPLVEMVTGMLFVSIALRLGADWALPAFLVFFAALLAVSVIDLELLIIPNRIVYPALGMSAALLVAAAVVDGDLRSLRGAVLGSALAWGLLLAVHLISPRGMGFGDVRLAALIGLHLGWISLGHVLLGLFLGFFFASVVGIALVIGKRKSRKDHVPFGPFLALGAVVSTLVGRELLRLYLGT